MSEQGAVCYTFEAAVEMAIEMEEEGFRNYLNAIRMVKHKGAREILKESALDELAHKCSLEKALLEGQMEGAETMERQIPTMTIGSFLAKKELTPLSDTREALAYAIHLEKGAIEFYRKLSQGCAGAPMGKIFDKLLTDESRHLQQLEDLYEEHFMTEN